MNIQILDSWIREHLKTNVDHEKFASLLSLCGPSVDRVEKVKSDGKTDYLYDIEVTTNRVDAMCVYGIAREASVILPEFGYRADLVPHNPKTITKEGNMRIDVKVDPKLTHRVMGVILEIEGLTKSPQWMIDRLKFAGIRSLSLPVDITNYVMLETGHPTHVFDYDTVKPTMIIRESRRGEKVVSLENKSYTLEDGDIVIANKDDEIIDLPGIIGTKNSIVNDNTRRILFFMETNDPIRIRKTSLRLGIRTNAAILNEKGVDPYLSEVALSKGIELFVSLAQARVVSRIIDIFPKKPTVKSIKLEHKFVERLLGVEISTEKVMKIMKNLCFDISINNSGYTITPPTFRAKDVEIPEDVVEEIARIYGYHKLPSVLMTGTIPIPSIPKIVDFENELKTILSGFGGNEIYTNSLVDKEPKTTKQLKILNPLGSDSGYLRTTLIPSLVSAADNNKNQDSFHLFEIANIYMPSKDNELPTEIRTLGGIIKGYDYRRSKGVVDAMFHKCRIETEYTQKDKAGFLKHRHVLATDFGFFGILKSGYFVYEFSLDKMIRSQNVPVFVSIPKFPPQIEDMTLLLPENTHVVDVLKKLKSASPIVSKVEYVSNYKNRHTFRITYQDNSKTLMNKDVNIIRNKIVNIIKLLGASIK